jgi:hypothetical protein
LGQNERENCSTMKIRPIINGETKNHSLIQRRILIGPDLHPMDPTERDRIFVGGYCDPFIDLIQADYEAASRIVEYMERSSEELIFQDLDELREEVARLRSDQLDTHAVELSRVLHAEAGGSLAGMEAVAHVINNRIASGSPASQVDTSSSWPDNFINTGFLLNPGRTRGTWPRATSAASRALARRIILQHGPPGTDPTGGALSYRAERRADLERTRPAFRHLSREVAQGRMRRVIIGGNVFYAPVR